LNKSVKFVVFALVAMFPFLANASNGYLKSIKEFELESHLGTTHTMDDYLDKDFVVMYIHGSGCPIARLSIQSFNEIIDEYSAKNIEFLMLNSFIQDDIPRIQGEAEQFGIKIPILKDADQSVARSLGVERTAEVFIIDPRSREVLFRGPIDDQLGYETQRTRATHHYLRDALDTVQAGGTVDMRNIPDAKGCLVGFFLS